MRTGGGGDIEWWLVRRLSVVMGSEWWRYWDWWEGDVRIEAGREKKMVIKYKVLNE